MRSTSSDDIFKGCKQGDNLQIPIKIGMPFLTIYIFICLKSPTKFKSSPLSPVLICNISHIYRCVLYISTIYIPAVPICLQVIKNNEDDWASSLNLGNLLQCLLAFKVEKLFLMFSLSFFDLWIIEYLELESSPTLCSSQYYLKLIRMMLIQMLLQLW